MILSEKKAIKRLAIFFFYDKDGIVDDYIPYMLNDLNKNISELLVVCNGKLTQEGRKKFKQLTSNILVRENKGFDVWAYKEGMEFYGWDNLKKFDEVILMNFTIFGPLYPFKEMFDEMDKRDLDFWGITKHHGFDFDPFGTIECGYIPEHIQSSFIAIRSDMINSVEFHLYWDHMGNINSYGEAVGKHEAIFTYKFNNYGFRSDVYINTDKLKDFTHYPLMLYSLELVKNMRCPVIKRKSFTNEYYEFLNCSIGNSTIDMYNYIRDNLDYNIDLIWDNILRTDNLADIKRRMHLNYILDNKNSLGIEKSKFRIALVMHIYYDDLINNCLRYAKSMPKCSDIYITTDTKEKKSKIEKIFSILKCNYLEINVIKNKGRDVSSLLVSTKKYIMKYDLVCFAHDKKTKQFIPYSIGESFSYKCFENILSTPQYVENIIDTFQNEHRLGLLSPPPPNHASFFGLYGTEWGSNFSITKDLANKLHLTVDIDINKEPIAPLGTMFWFRPKALKILFDYDWDYSDFPKEPNNNDGTLIHAIERIYPFIVQQSGYYVGWCMNNDFAKLEFTNLNFMLREVSQTIYRNVGHYANFAMLNHVLLQTLPFKNILVYKIRNKLKKHLPRPLFKLAVQTKRLILGPRGLKGNYD